MFTLPDTKLVPRTTGYGDKIKANGEVYVVSGIRLRGSFNGKGYEEFTLTHVDDDSMPTITAYCNRD